MLLCAGSKRVMLILPFIEVFPCRKDCVKQNHNKIRHIDGCPHDNSFQNFE